MLALLPPTSSTKRPGALRPSSTHPCARALSCATAWNPDHGPSSLLGVAFPGWPLSATSQTRPRTCSPPPALFSSCHPVVDTLSPCPVALSVSPSFSGKPNSSFDLVVTNLRDNTGFRRFLETQLECSGKPWLSSFQLSGIRGERAGATVSQQYKRGILLGAATSSPGSSKGTGGRDGEGHVLLPRSLQRSGCWSRKR